MGDVPGQLRQALAQNGAAGYPLATGRSERLDSGDDIGAVSGERTKGGKFVREGPGFFYRRAHQQQRQQQ